LIPQVVGTYFFTVGISIGGVDSLMVCFVFCLDVFDWVDRRVVQRARVVPVSLFFFVVFAFLLLLKTVGHFKRHRTTGQWVVQRDIVIFARRVTARSHVTINHW